MREMFVMNNYPQLDPEYALRVREWNAEVVGIRAFGIASSNISPGIGVCVCGQR